MSPTIFLKWKQLNSEGVFLKLKVESKLACICSSRYQLHLKSSLKVYRLISKREWQLRCRMVLYCVVVRRPGHALQLRWCCTDAVLISSDRLLLWDWIPHVLNFSSPLLCIMPAFTKYPACSKICSLNDCHY